MLVSTVMRVINSKEAGAGIAALLGVVIPLALVLGLSGGGLLMLVAGFVALVAIIAGARSLPRFWPRVGRGVLTGAVAGAMVMGPGLRLAMRVVAILEPSQTPEFTAGGTLFIVVLGLILGAIFGIGVSLNADSGRRRPVGFVVAAGGLGLLLITPDLRTELLELGFGWPLNVPMFGAVFYAYAAVVLGFVRRRSAAGDSSVVDLEGKEAEASWTGG